MRNFKKGGLVSGMNPFIYGEEVEGENFCNRLDEIKALASEIESFQNILIYSPRRYGKTSLMNEVFKKLKRKGFLTFYIDLYPVVCEDDFIRISLKSISRVIGRTGKNILKRLKEYIKQISSSLFLTFSEDGTPSLGVNLSKTEILPAVDDLFNGLYNYISGMKKPAVVVFDEFQQLGELENNRVEKILRSIIQKQRRLSYVFMGSKKHLIYDMFNNPGRPFYKSTRHFPLKTIEKSLFSRFIKQKFIKSGIRLEIGVPDDIVQATESHPYYTQMLAHMVWELTREKKYACLEDVRTSIDSILDQEEAAFSNLWDSLTLKQRRLLLALSLKKEDEKIYSVDFIDKYNLGSGSTVQRGIKSLINKNIIDKEGDKFLINDIFLKRWLRTRMNP
jgi:AAA+ ATPase superfamily predicted ATPase